MEKIQYMETTIITDHKWKQFKYGNEVPQKVINSDFDWLDEEDKFDGFIMYRKRWYHVSEFMSCHNKIYSPNNPWLKLGYDGYLGNSFFSGVLIKLSDDNEEYQIATYIS